MQMFEYGIPNPGDEAEVDGERKIIASYGDGTVNFTDGTSAEVSDITRVFLNQSNSV